MLRSGHFENKLQMYWNMKGMQCLLRNVRRRAEQQNKDIAKWKRKIDFHIKMNGGEANGGMEEKLC